MSQSPYEEDATSVQTEETLMHRGTPEISSKVIPIDEEEDEVIPKYIKTEDRLEDVFQDETIEAFPMITDFKKFARSKRGLCLAEYELQCIADNEQNVEDQKMRMLNRWREINGTKATAMEIRFLVERFRNHLDPNSKDFIKLSNGAFVMYIKKNLGHGNNVFLGEQTSEVEGCSHPCVIKLTIFNRVSLREAKALTKLRNHENVVSILRVGEYRERLHNYIYIAMDLAWTRHLRDVLEKCKQLDPDDQIINLYRPLDFVFQILKGLVHIHDHRIIHRDLKPENVLVSEDYKNIKLNDFGVCKQINDGCTTKQTNQGIGTEGYSSPETYNASEISLSTDVYSVGIMIAEMISNGQHPFGNNSDLWKHKIKQKMSPDLSHLCISNKSQMEELLKQMMHPYPNERPTAKEVLNNAALEQAQIVYPSSFGSPKVQSTTQKATPIEDDEDEDGDVKPEVVSPSPFPIVIPPEAHLQFVPTAVLLKSQRSRRVSYGDGIDEESFSTSVETILFDPQETPAAVLKHVLKDATAKEELEKICVEFAKVVVENNEGHIQIQFSSKEKNFSPAQRGNANKAITYFLKKFVSRTRNIDNDLVKNLIKYNKDIFKSKPELHVRLFNLFNDSTMKKVKITGRIDVVKKKLDEIEYEMKCETEEEELPADIFIAQRQCEVWKTVVEQCKKEGFKISISSSNEESKIIYRGLPNSIKRAKINLGKICESLISHPVSGLSSDQLEFIKRCEESQKNFKTGKNILDSLYKRFQIVAIRGSLSFQPSSIVLTTTYEDEWQSGNLVLKNSVECFEIAPVLTEISYARYFSDLKKYFDGSPVFVKDLRAVKKIMLVCFKSDSEDIKQQIKQFDDGIESIEGVKFFYPMPENVAQHILNHCKIEKAKNIQLVIKEGRKSSLRITYDKEDSIAVEMRLDELQQEITSKDIKLTGYSLFEYLTGEGKANLSVIEQQTNCSIFLKSSDKVGVVKSFISVKVGDILDERCDAILNSTGAELSLSGQVSRALIQKYGQNVIEHCIQTSKWLIPAQLSVCSSYAYNLPWKYIFNIVIPNDEQELKHALIYLLPYANSLKITSLALPAIGTGNLGLDPTIVAKCMKEAFAEVTQVNFANLKDVRLVLYDPIMLPIFKDVVSVKENMSSGAVATVYGNTPENLRQAEQGLKDYRDKIIKTSIIKNATSAFAITCISEICEKYDVCLEWKQNSMLEKECHLHGVSDRVKKAEEEIRKLLEAAFPPYWSPMTAGETVKRYKLTVGSSEYETVRAKFAESSPSYVKIKHIERIQNHELYKTFKPQKDMRMADNPGQSVTRQLFHATLPDKVDLICRSGFDRGFTGENGTAYGRGSYFALKSSSSMRYTGHLRIKYIFLAEVITGDYTQGHPEYKTAPEKDSTGMKYDSCVDNVSDPTIFVVFRDVSAYPSYLITFQ